jgi:hypothetical protein
MKERTTGSKRYQAIVNNCRVPSFHSPEGTGRRRDFKHDRKRGTSDEPIAALQFRGIIKKERETGA